MFTTRDALRDLDDSQAAGGVVTIHIICSAAFPSLLRLCVVDCKAVKMTPSVLTES